MRTGPQKTVLAKFNKGCHPLAVLTLRARPSSGCSGVRQYNEHLSAQEQMYNKQFTRVGKEPDNDHRKKQETRRVLCLDR